jgi:ribosomal protein L15E
LDIRVPTGIVMVCAQVVVTGFAKTVKGGIRRTLQRWRQKMLQKRIAMIRMRARSLIHVEKQTTMTMTMTLRRMGMTLRRMGMGNVADAGRVTQVECSKIWIWNTG